MRVIELKLGVLPFSGMRGVLAPRSGVIIRKTLPLALRPPLFRTAKLPEKLGNYVPWRTLSGLMTDSLPP